MGTPVCRITSRSGHVTEYTDLDDAFAAITRAVSKKRAVYPHFAIVGVVGSRRRATNDDAEIVADAMFEIASAANELSRDSGWTTPAVAFVSGDCPTGADRMAKDFALGNYDLIEFPAQWDLLGKSAGFKRNEHIARISDHLIACVAPDRTGGTEDTIKHFARLHPTVKVRLV